MKTKIILVVLLLSFLLCGCTVEADRIYVVCKQTENVTYVYDGNGNFYTYQNSNVQPYIGKDLQAEPRLTLTALYDDDLSYQLDYELPTVYNATLIDALHYIATTLQNDSAMFVVTEVDWKSFEVLVTTEDYDMRALYSSDNRLRLYAVDKEGNAIEPPYTK